MSKQAAKDAKSLPQKIAKRRNPTVFQKGVKTVSRQTHEKTQSLSLPPKKKPNDAIPVQKKVFKTVPKLVKRPKVTLPKKWANPPSKKVSKQAAKPREKTQSPAPKIKPIHRPNMCPAGPQNLDNRRQVSHPKWSQTTQSPVRYYVNDYKPNNQIA